MANFKRAAESAAAALPKLLKRQASISENIDSLQNVIKAWETISGTTLPLEGANGAPSVRSRRGQVVSHVEQALSDLKGPVSEREIREAIETATGITYSRGAVYSALNRGKGTGAYENTDGKWSKRGAA